MKMALNCSSSTCITFPYNKIRNPTNTSSLTLKTGFFHLTQKSPFRVSAATSPAKARFVASRKESVRVRQLQRPLIEYMSLPASQYSVLDAERIERVDDNTFRCYVYRFKFFAFEICPVLLVRVEEQPNGCCIKLLSCKLEGSPIVVAQNDKFDASMINRISCDSNSRNSEVQQLTSDAFIEVSIEVPFAFRAFPVEAIESSGTQVLDQILKLMLPRFMSQKERKQLTGFGCWQDCRFTWIVGQISIHNNFGL
ncbi:(rap annotation release2) galactose-binding like domain containing protein [Citrus sinensis]|nr:(rap annotation release2) galactose-binding like domain containing protein [Citrus sinensis]